MLSRKQNLAYGVADVAGSTSYNTINVHLLFFLVTVLGLNPALAGSVLLVGRVIDAFTDPLMGILSDRFKVRLGSRLVFVRWGMIPFGISFALIWFLTPQANDWQLFALAAILLTLHTTIFTVVQVSYLATTPDLAPNYQARTILTSYRVAFATLASLIATALPPLLASQLAALLPGLNPALVGWRGVGILFGIIMVLSFLPLVTLIKEPQTTASASGFSNLRDIVQRLLRTRGYPQVVLIFVLATLGIGIVASMLPFYLDAALSLNPEQATVALGVLFIAAALSMPLWTYLAKKWDKARALSCGAVVLATSLVLVTQLPLPAGISLPFGLLALAAGMGLGAVLLFPWAMLPDTVTATSNKTSSDAQSGLLYACFSLAQKTSFAIGVFANGQVLARAGFDAELATQSTRAINAIQTMVGPVAACCFVLMGYAAWRYPLRKSDVDAASTQ
ncbi:MAG: MFS transporter [Deinococcota bacterium]